MKVGQALECKIREVRNENQQLLKQRELLKGELETIKAEETHVRSENARMEAKCSELRNQLSRLKLMENQQTDVLQKSENNRKETLNEWFEYLEDTGTTLTESLQKINQIYEKVEMKLHPSGEMDANEDVNKDFLEEKLLRQGRKNVGLKQLLLGSSSSMMITESSISENTPLTDDRQADSKSEACSMDVTLIEELPADQL
eukprot:CAMPEP_0185270342 /NCGR_PEP_ID=MMETSP1359-20130426/42087_1 /TAXON_ID=552665 /ORGANISM="Bigelowiella longifila, Strain CCMP242" /LENGTH=200 /DNA_ID=CAMNT_0027861851 /DNA_START=11 /DNA_END=613 /DNA_ORIENTATION=+